LERLRAGSHRFYALLVLGGIAVALAALAAARIYDSGGSSNLRPLPPGPPQSARRSASVERVTLDEMLRRADAIFVGTASAIGGSENVSGGSPPEVPIIAVHRVRFDVDQSFRGATSSPIDVLLDTEGGTYPFTVGEKYLIFAEQTEVGPVRAPALIPSGYAQEVYPVVTATLARNDSTALSTSSS
jgi:hypothetical protein